MSQPTPKYPLETLVLLPLFGWMSNLVLVVLWHERAHPILPFLLLVPAWDAAGKRIGSLRARAQGHAEDFHRFSGLWPVPLYSRGGLRRLFAVVAAAVLGTAVVFLMYGRLAVRTSGSSDRSISFMGVFIALFLATIYIYRPFTKNLPRFRDAIGIMNRGLWPVLGSAILVWLLADALFADVYQRLWDLCTRTPLPSVCNGGPMFSGSVGSTINALYFSSATLATVGYGDIAPLAPIARALVTVEIVLGVSLLAFVVGRVVSYAPPMDSQHAPSVKEAP